MRIALSAIVVLLGVNLLIDLMDSNLVNIIEERNEVDERDKDSNVEDHTRRSNQHPGSGQIPQTQTNYSVDENAPKPKLQVVSDGLQSRNLMLPKQDDCQLHQRMQSIIVQKVTKMYSSSGEMKTNSISRSDSVKKVSRGQALRSELEAEPVPAGPRIHNCRLL